MDNFKKTISVILCATMFCAVFASFAACGLGDKSPASTTGAQTSASTPAETTAGTPEVSTPNTNETTSAPETDPPETGAFETTAPAGTDTTAPKPSDTTVPSDETDPPKDSAKTSGRFEMETGTSFDFYLDWKLNGFEDGYALIQMDVVLSTYQLYISARKNLGIITVNGEVIRFSTEKIEQDEKKKVDILLHSEVLRVKLDGDSAVAEIKVEWFFNGTYSDIEFEWLEAGGIVSVSKN